jgi:hypothetical protein
MAKKKATNLLPKLTEVEQDLLSHMEEGYQLSRRSPSICIGICESAEENSILFGS